MLMQQIQIFLIRNITVQMNLNIGQIIIKLKILTHEQIFHGILCGLMQYVRPCQSKQNSDKYTAL